MGKSRFILSFLCGLIFLAFFFMLGRSPEEMLRSSADDLSPRSNTGQLSAAQKTTVRPISNPARKILINEILFNPVGSDSGKEFIELFNPNDSSIDLSGWSLKISTNNEPASPLIKIGGSRSDLTSVKFQRPFLIGFNSYSSSPSADAKRSAALPNTQATIYLVDPNGITAEIITYDDSIPEGNSLKRISIDDRTFKIEPDPDPRNSTSSEP